MVQLNRQIDRGPAVIRESHNTLRAARATYKKAFNIAYSMAEGTQMDRKVHAELTTEDEAAALDVAEIEYRYLNDLLDAYKTKLRALQSISSLMKAQMFQGNAS